MFARHRVICLSPCCFPVITLFAWDHVVSLGSRCLPGIMLFAWDHVVCLGSCCLPGIMLFACDHVVCQCAVFVCHKGNMCISFETCTLTRTHARTHTHTHTHTRIQEQGRTHALTVSEGMEDKVKEPVVTTQERTSVRQNFKG